MGGQNEIRDRIMGEYPYREKPKANRPKGEWIDRVRSYFDEYDKKGRNPDFLHDLALDSGRPYNALWREFRAYAYLLDKNVDPSTWRNPQALMAVEAVMRLGKVDPAAESHMLAELISGGGSVRMFKDAARRAQGQTPAPTYSGNSGYAGRESLVATSKVTLTSVLVQWLSRHPSKILIQFPQDATSPLACVVRQGESRIAVIVADKDRAALQGLAFERAIEIATAVAAQTCDEVILCSNIGLPAVERALEDMPPEAQSRVHFYRSPLEIDVDHAPGGVTEFADVFDMIRR